MPFKYQLSEEAELDVLNAYDWYEEQQLGLGSYFLEALDKAEKAIIRNPTSFRFRHKNKVRGFVVDKFPFPILYVVSQNTIDVISVFHTSQRPNSWQSRLT